MSALPYYTRPDKPPPRMRYWAAYKFVWTSPKGWKNLLLCGVCVLIPVVGVLVLVGYLRDVFVARLDTLDDDRIGYPDFDFKHFGEYLTRGLWPFVVSLVAGLALVPIFLLFMMAGVFILPAMRLHGPLLVAAAGSFYLLGFAVLVVSNVLTVPLMLRAAILEEFGPSFSWGWIKDFAQRTWREILLSMLFLMVTSIPLVLVGYAMCLVGVYPAAALATFAQWHLHFQVYRIYLSRGGEFVPPKPVFQPPMYGFPMQPYPMPPAPPPPQP